MTLLIEGRNLKKHYPLKSDLFFGAKKFLHAVDGVDVLIKEGETLGLAGESGSGKSTLGRLLCGFIQPTDGTVKFMGREISEIRKRKDIKELRRQMQIIFQDPMASLNPRKSVRQILSKPFKIHHVASSGELKKKSMELLEMVGICPAELYIDRYPHEFSGGQRQRIVIARAIALEPKFIVADEPVSSLDISIRAQILNLMKKLQREFGITFLYISHDLSVLRSLCDKVAIMYAGEIVEKARTDDLFATPLHPYTEALLSATPIPNPRKARGQKVTVLKGEAASSIDVPSGCRFHTRCPIAMPKCAQEKPKLVDIGAEHQVACNSRT